MIHLDTHVMAWLYARDRRRLPPPVIARMEEDRVAVSPIVELELQVLFELDRINVPARVLIDEVRHPLGLSVSDTPFAEVVRAGESLTWTRDPFDRLIAANARADGARLLTADRTIRAHLPEAVWDEG